MNMALGTNYAYLGSGHYEATSVVDVLGPWPWRLLAMIGGAGAVFTLLYWTALLTRRVRRRFVRAEGDEPSGTLETA